MKHAAVLTVTIILMALFSAPQSSKAANVTNSHGTSTIEQLWEVAGFSMPESVAISPTDNWIYVSNVNGDKSGYISRLTKDGKVDNLQWLTGLDNPAGLGLYEQTLYVGDGTQLHLIDVQQGKVLKSIFSNEAVALNDVTISKSGQVFVSDIASGKIFTLEADSLKVWFTTPEIAHPNGLFIQDNHLFVADFASELSHQLTPKQYGSLYKVNLFDKSYNRIASATQLGGLDGIASINNGLLVSSNPTGELFAITDKERILVGTFDKGLADISMAGDTLYAPLLFSNKLAAYRLQGTNFTSTTFQKWTHVTTKEALSIGLVTFVATDSEVVVEAITLGQNLANNLDKNALAIFKRPWQLLTTSLLLLLLPVISAPLTNLQRLKMQKQPLLALSKNNKENS